MILAVRNSWPLFLGLLLLMAGNALQGAALGVRSVDVFSNEVYGIVSAGYFAGFLLGSQLTPILLRRVGHIRVFAALGSLISVAVLVFVVWTDPFFWFALRFVVGFGFSGVYIVAESWVNSISTNQTRGQTLAAYMFIQFSGVVIGQQLLAIGDPAGAGLFILMSVMVSLSFAPILLSVTPAPVYATARPLSLRELFAASPLGAFGAAMMGGAYGVMFGMGSVYGALLGMSVLEIAQFLTMLYLGGVIFQVPVGWLSDRMDRRVLIIGICIATAALAALGVLVSDTVLTTIGGIRIFSVFIVAFLFGAFVNPLYGVLLAHTNDYVETDQMAAAAGRFIFLNGLGAFFGPIVGGYVMGGVGAAGFWLMCAGFIGAIAVFGLYRSTQRPSVAVDDTGPHAQVSRSFTPVAAEMAQEISIERAAEQAEEAGREDADQEETERALALADAADRRRPGARRPEQDEEDDERASWEAVDND